MCSSRHGNATLVVQNKGKFNAAIRHSRKQLCFRAVAGEILCRVLFSIEVHEHKLIAQKSNCKVPVLFSVYTRSACREMSCLYENQSSVSVIHFLHPIVAFSSA
jgi:hypothetical protein